MSHSSSKRKPVKATKNKKPLDFDSSIFTSCAGSQENGTDDQKSSSLDFSGNNIGAEGAKAIALLESLKALTSLALRFNKIGDEGAKTIADSKIINSLNTLDLSSNNIGAEGAKAIAESENFGLVHMIREFFGHGNFLRVVFIRQAFSLRFFILAYLGSSGRRRRPDDPRLSNTRTSS